MRALLIVTASALSLGACSSQKPARPTGPPPEYERPVVMPWDSGTPVDPLDNAEGEEVTDDEPADAGSDAIPTGDAALSPNPPTS
jgi:hypothetical protein